MKPYVLNHQFNRIIGQAKQLLTTLQTSNDPKVVEAARFRAVTKALEGCPGLSGEELQLVERLAEIRSAEDLQVYTAELAAYRLSFPVLTDAGVRKLFPKVKKLRVPDIEALAGLSLTYLGWLDTGANRMFMVYPRANGAEGLTGVEGRFVAVGKKGICAFCNRSGETVLFTAVSKKKMSHMPDYYKAVGQYICADSMVCNSRIQDLEALEQFVESVEKG